MSTMTPEQFANRMSTFVRTGGMERVLAAVAAQSSLTMDREAKLRTTGGNPLHVRTGALRMSIKADWGVDAVERVYKASVRAGGRRAFYARFHEFGEGNNPKRPFLAPARAVAVDELENALIQQTRSALRTVGLGA